MPLIKPSSSPGAVFNAAARNDVNVDTHARRHGAWTSQVGSSRRANTARTGRSVGRLGAVESPEEGRSVGKSESHSFLRRSFIRRIARGLQDVNDNQLCRGRQPQLASPGTARRSADCALHPRGCRRDSNACAMRQYLDRCGWHDVFDTYCLLNTVQWEVPTPKSANDVRARVRACVTDNPGSQGGSALCHNMISWSTCHPYRHRTLVRAIMEAKV